jgi:hypothetical protein
MLGWWCGLPGRGGGPNWYDLMRARAGVQAGSAGWSGNTRPGRLGACPTYVPASSQYTDISSLEASLTGLTELTIAFWCLRTSATYSCVGRPASALNLFWRNNNVLYFQMSPGIAYCTPSIQTGWHHIAGVYNYAAGAGTGSRLKLFFDGAQQTVTSAEPPSSIGAGSGFAIGRMLDNSTVSYATGAQDDVAIWSRALSALEVWTWYDQSRRGHPDTIRRWSMMAFDAAAATFKPWFVRRSQVLGSGVY